jgi:hypothetical protein
MSPETKDKLDAALQHVKPNRRDLLKRLLVGGGATALLAPMSEVLAAREPAHKSAAQISKCIENKFKAQGYGGLKPEVRNDGAVVLTGTVENSAAKTSLTQIARGCGATKVTNNMSLVKQGKSKVKPPLPPAKTGG